MAKAVQVGMQADTYQDQYIKLERVGPYIRKTEGKIKKYQEQLGKLRQKGAQKNMAMIQEIGQKKTVIT